MKLITYCKACKNAHSISDHGILFRTDLQEKYGEAYSYSCSKCGTHNSKGINQIYAVESKNSLLIGLTIGLSIIGWGLYIKNKDPLSILWTTAVGAVIIIYGFFANLNTTAKAFNRTFI